MKRLEFIINNITFKQCCSENKAYEIDRKFCKHNLKHFIDVARIAYIYNLENDLGFDKEIIYSTALLHDIGRWKQYKFGFPHEKASAEIAKDILKDCQFNKDEAFIITDAILNHRELSGDKKSLNYILCFADKKSRMCFKCKSEKKCNWNENKKNKSLMY